MRHRGNGTYERDDIWREGKWLDLWSVVHFLSGVSMAFIMYLFSFGVLASFVIAFILLVAYEMWEAMVKIEETPQNRFMDVVVGMISFAPTFVYFAPALSTLQYIFAFGVIFTINIILSVFGWSASQKALELETKLKAEYIEQRTRLIERRIRMRTRIKNRRMRRIARS